MSRLRPPIRRKGNGFVIDLGNDERDVVGRLLSELRELLLHPDVANAAELTERLFPVTHPDDAEMEAEYQRLMREELVASKLSALDRVAATLHGDGRVDEGGLLAFMQSVNSIRLVLAVMLDITDDGDDGDGDDGDEARPEYGLYHYLSYLLDTAVRVQQ